MQKKINKRINIIWLVIIGFYLLSLFLIWRFVFFQSLWKRFVYKDWIILHQICEWQKIDIDNIYGEKNTDFKKYLKKYYEK